MIMKIFHKNRGILVKARKVSSLGKITGLMFKTRNSENLLFEFKTSKKRAIHSFFVFFPFLAIWLDDKNNILEWRIVRPFEYKVLPSVNFRRFLEIPLSYGNHEIVQFIVGKKKGLNT